jgi:small subunit ribosomal protein S9
MAKKEKIVQTKARKKTALARARIKEGVGEIKVNGIPLAVHKPEFARDVMLEPIAIAQDVLGKNFEYGLNIVVNVSGGGIMGQAYATRTAIGKALIKWTENDDLKKAYLNYDRSLIIDDIRRKEPKKYLRKGARARPTKSFR